MTPMSSSRIDPARQRGAVLAVSLIILVVLTLVSVTAMRGTLIDERVSGNFADSNVALQAAEAALRDGEQILQQPLLPDFNNTNGLYQPAPAASAPRWQTINWNSAAAVRSYGGFAGAPSPLEKASARYFLEELPVLMTPGESLSADTPVDEVGMYRITARGVGIGGNAVAVLQTTYKR